MKQMEAWHYLALGPTRLKFFDWKVLRLSIWKNWRRDGISTNFYSLWLFNHLQFYYGAAKVDGSQTYDWGTFDEFNKPLLAVYTDQPEEKVAFRWRTKGPGESHWNNQGGS